MMKKIAIGVGAIIAGILLFALTRPDSFAVQRTAQINASPDQILPLIADFHRWAEWSPWEKLDPNMKRTYSGAESGQGAKYAWEGNNKVGAGSMEIVDLSSAAPMRVGMALHFIKPFEAHNKAEFTLMPVVGGTQVTWSMSGKNSYPSKVMSILINMDKMIGKSFDEGLANLKAVIEKGTSNVG